jgi:hypothetical protein
LFSDAELATDIKDGSACFDLTQSVGYLLFGEVGSIYQDLLHNAHCALTLEPDVVD